MRRSPASPESKRQRTESPTFAWLSDDLFLSDSFVPTLPLPSNEEELIRSITSTWGAPTKIGSGGNSCIFKPPAPCNGTLPPDCIFQDACVMRTATTSAGSNAVGEMVRGIDPTQQFTIQQYEHQCEGPPDIIGREIGVDLRTACPTAVRGDTTTVTYLPTAIGDMFDILDGKFRTLMLPDDVPRRLHNLFDGLADFAAKDFVHGDVKIRNVMIETSGKFKFIDFDFSFKWEGVASARKYLRQFMDTDPYYFVWPPETVLLKKFMLGSQEPLTLDFVRAFVSRKLVGTLAMPKDKSLEDVSVQYFEAWKPLVEKNLRFNKYRLTDDAILAMVQKFDTYSLGITCIEINDLLGREAVPRSVWQPMTAPSPLQRPPASVTRDAYYAAFPVHL